MMLNILNYIRDREPDIYSRTQYHIIEISDRLANVQHESLSNNDVRWSGHEHIVQIFNKSIFEWDTSVTNPCFVLGFEILDNLSHDVVRFQLSDGKPLQGIVVIDPSGDYHETFTPVLDPVVLDYLKVSSALDHSPLKAASRIPPRFRSQYGNLPFAPNMTQSVYIPTMSLQLLRHLHQYFPSHRLVFSDFSHLPDTIPGVNSPVVQTRYKKVMVPCSTYMVHPGYFDIFFPTNFSLLSNMHATITQQDTTTKGRPVWSHEEFCRRWADCDATRLKNGENPLLEMYSNAKCLLT